MAAVLLLFLAALTVSAAGRTLEQTEFFEKKVRPVLAERCYKCHSTQSEKLKGGLLLDSAEGVLKGGEDGPILTPGEPEKSKIIEAINYQNPDLQMPPKGKLPVEEIAIITEWVKMGAPWPGSKQSKPEVSIAGFDLEKRRREHWAWQPIKPQHPPPVRNKAWPSNPPDNFILAELEKNHLDAAPAANRRVLIRRVYFDLIGLPPTPEEVECFVKDTSPKAYDKVVDHLLASPCFGERWARHWLDLVRYSETLGHEFDYSLHNAWRYRDYVIRAFNADIPYDQFVTEHVAGDLLDKPRRHPTERFNESVIGTGFFWLGQREHSPVDVRQHQAELIDNQIDVMCKTFLGLTVACARCHDHKFDAIATKDFYALYGVLESSRYNQKAIDSVALPKIQALKKLKTEIRRTAASQWLKQANEISAESLGTWAAKGEPGPENLFYPWLNVSLTNSKTPQQFQDAWGNMLRAAAASTETGTNYQVYARAIGGRLDGWFADGDAFALGCGGEGNFIIGATNLTILHEASVDDRALSRRLEGSLRSPGFKIQNRYIHIKAAGRDSRIRICVDNFTMIRDPIYGGLMKNPDSDKAAWLTFDVKMWQGHRAFIEFLDTSTPDPTNESIKPGAGASGWMSVSCVLFSDGSTPPPLSEPALWLKLLGPQAPNSLDSLAARYRTAFTQALQIWRTDQPRDTIADRAKLAFLDFLLQNGLLDLGSRASPLSNLLAEYRRIESSIPGPVRVPAMVDGDGFDENVFIRGNHKTLGSIAPRQFLTALATGKGARFTEGSGRLELAHCMTDSSDPFLARVMVNRVWLHLFGRGIVPTPDDFGKLGQPPANPALLDWLAIWYRTKAHWSTKELIRLLVTSSAYRMESKPADPLAEEKDPDNLLLHRMPIRRLEGEAIRDSMLAISGRLDSKMFGPPVPAHLTEFMEGRGRPSSSGPLDGAGRRSVYLEVRRNFLSPMMRTFDTPVPFTTIGKRTVSNVPAQSLILLNDPFVFSQAQLWAHRLLADHNCSPEQRIRRIYSMALGRLPTTDEQTKAVAFLQQQALAYGADSSERWRDERVWTDYCHVIFNVKEFVFLE